MTSSDLGESLWDGAQPNTSSLIASDAALKLQPAENSFGVLFVSSNDWVSRVSDCLDKVKGFSMPIRLALIREKRYSDAVTSSSQESIARTRPKIHYINASKSIKKEPTYK